MSKELTEKWKNRTLEEDFYYVENKSCLGVEIDYYNVLHSGIKYWSGCEDEDVEEVLSPVPTYDQFSQLVKKVEGLKQQLEYAERTLKNIRLLMTCDPSDMKELDENFCANQLALETVNGYFEKYGVEK